ncbi:MAG TPA: hypothetical protein VFK43_18710, partial [Acidimicrobiales bacterium]|nr:hypothetical protein [Acidimicrobiales bacterium]
MTTRTRARRAVAPLALVLGLALGGCAGGSDGPDKADAPAAGTPAAAEGSTTTVLGAGALAGQPGQPGQPRA